MKATTKHEPDNYTIERLRAQAGCGMLMVAGIVTLCAIALGAIGLAVYAIVRVATVGHVF